MPRKESNSLETLANSGKGKEKEKQVIFCAMKQKQNKKDYIFALTIDLAMPLSKKENSQRLEESVNVKRRENRLRERNHTPPSTPVPNRGRGGRSVCKYSMQRYSLALCYTQGTRCTECFFGGQFF